MGHRPLPCLVASLLRCWTVSCLLICCCLQSCQQHALHPFSEAAAQQHAASCARLAASIAKRKQDGAIECSICYEKVLGKAAMSERRFGLMACEHAFCLGCIRNWRSTAEVDKATALRTCPICRTPTHFITPSTKWPDTAAEKESIVSAYKAAMGCKDCTHFAFGEGSCPFGTSCFYRHAYKDGRLEEVHLRRAANDEGQAQVLRPVQLSSFLEASLTARRALSRRPAASQRQQQQQRDQGREQQHSTVAGSGINGSSSSSGDDGEAAGPAAGDGLGQGNDQQEQLLAGHSAGEQDPLHRFVDMHV